MSNSATSLATVCIAIREPTFAQLLFMYIKGKNGILDIIKCKTFQSLLEFSEVPGKKILLLDAEFYGMHCFADIKNITSQVNAETTVMFCDDNDTSLLQQLIDLNFKGYLLKTTDHEIIRQALNILLKGVEFLDNAINNIIRPHISSHIVYNNIKFTACEYKLLMAIKKGDPPVIIYKMLDITQNTYAEYRGRINKKIHSKGFKDINEFISKYV